MRKPRIVSRLTIITLLVAIITSMAIPTCAKDFPFSYIKWVKTQKNFTVYTGDSNEKEYNGQEATVKGTSVEYDTRTNGWGFRVVVEGKGSNPVTILPSNGTEYTDVTKRTYWLNGNYTIHPQYKDGYGGNGIEHYVAARLDDDSATGSYSFYGAFNSDYT